MTGKSPVLTMGLRTLTTMSGGRTPAIVAAQLSAALTTFTHRHHIKLSLCQQYEENIFPIPAICEQENKPVLRINEMLVWIRIPGSMPLILLFSSFKPSRSQQKTKFFRKFFCLLLFEGTLILFFKDKSSKRSHKTVRTKVFLTIFT